MIKGTKMAEPVNPPEPVTKGTGCNALSYQINHADRRLARLGEKLRGKGRRYGNERNKNALARNVAKGAAEVGNSDKMKVSHNAGIIYYLFILLFCVSVSSGQYPS